MTTIAIGTMKGAFFGTEADAGWELHGPHHAGWKVTAFGRAPGGDHLLALGSNWYGAAIHRSADLEHWSQVVDGPSYDEGRKLNQIWRFHADGGRLYAGVDEAGLFTSDDDAETWSPVEGLNDHASRTGWEPGLGGLCAHAILGSGDDLWCGISAVGVFRSNDGGAHWTLVNKGVTVAAQHDEFDIGYCVHGLAQDEDPLRIYRQDHRGVYRTTDGGETWHKTEKGLPSGFGFPMVRDASSGNLFVVPLESDEVRLPVDGAFRIYRSTDGAESWHVSGTGWPTSKRYAGVLRGAMAGDDRGTVAAGTTSGEVWITRDAGETWSQLPWTLPRILAVAVW